MKSTGYVFKSRDYIGSAEPPATALEDESRFGNDGVFKGDGSPDWVLNPAGLWVAEFDGDDNIILPSVGFPIGNLPWTMECWVKVTTVPTSGDYDGIVFHGTATAEQGLLIYVLDVSGTPYFYASNLTANTLVGTTEVIVNTWYHLVFTHDGTTQRFYVNGVEEGNTATITIGIVLDACRIGSFGASSQYLIGQVGKMRIRHGASPVEVAAAHYQAERHWFGI